MLWEWPCPTLLWKWLCPTLGMVVPDFALEMVVSDFGNGRARLCFGNGRVRLWKWSCPTLLWKWSCPTLEMVVPDFALEMIVSDFGNGRARLCFGISRVRPCVCVRDTCLVCAHSPVRCTLLSCETLVSQAASVGGHVGRYISVPPRALDLECTVVGSLSGSFLSGIEFGSRFASLRDDHFPRFRRWRPTLTMSMSHVYVYTSTTSRTHRKAGWTKMNILICTLNISFDLESWFGCELFN